MGGDASLPVFPGVLALQGDYDLHARALARLGFAACRRVKRPADLEGVTHLILPGGESTVISHFLEGTGLADLIRRRALANDLACFGTCAGAILLGREPSHGEAQTGRQPRRLALADVEVRRNAFGRQRESFRAPLALAPAVTGDDAGQIEAVFIRAPRIGALGPGVEVLATLGDDEGNEPVCVRAGRLLLATFHPELSRPEPDGRDLAIHRYFMTKV